MYREKIVVGKAEWIYEEKEIALFAVGSMVKTAEAVYHLCKKAGFSVSLINARFVKPIDEEAVLKACENHSIIVTLEENVASGGYGEKVLACMKKYHKENTFLSIHIPDAYVEHGNVEMLKKEIGVDVASIFDKIECCRLREQKN